MDLNVDHVAHLARLELTPEEHRQFGAQLGQILEYINRLQELDTDGIEATFQPVPRVNVLREDETGPCLSAEEALANAPDHEGRLFRMPRILEE